jgi:hypothetical protein
MVEIVNDIRNSARTWPCWSESSRCLIAACMRSHDIICYVDTRFQVTNMHAHTGIAVLVQEPDQAR